jgi:RNA polymerase sigma factor (sigma-70 family)
LADPNVEDLWRRDVEEAWSLFVDRYRRLIIAVIRRYVSDPDDVMDVFAHVCAALRENDLARLKRFREDVQGGASFSTWLVVVVRNLAVDWTRRRDGRPRPQAPPDLPPIHRRIYESLFIHGRSQRETFELLHATPATRLSHAAYLHALREVHRIAFREAPGTLARPIAVPSSGAVSAGSDEEVIAAETRRHLKDAMLALEPDVRLAVELFVVEDMAAADVARVLGWPNAKSVYNNVYRAFATLRERLARLGIHSDDV